MKNAVFWDVTPCGSRRIQYFGRTRIGELGTMLAVTSNSTLQRNTYFVTMLVFLRSVLLLVTANVVPSSPILVTLMMEATNS
jgi:hypothetical protein